jgi:Protein of unknown function (DUF2892)
MKSNISIGDGIIRLFVGIAWAGFFGGYLTSYIAILGMYPIVTSMSGWCLIYALKERFTTDTNPYKELERASSSATEGNVVDAPSKYRMTA